MSLIWKLLKKKKKIFVCVGLFTYVVVGISFGVLDTDSEFKKKKKKNILPTHIFQELAFWVQVGMRLG